MADKTTLLQNKVTNESKSDTDNSANILLKQNFEECKGNSHKFLYFSACIANLLGFAAGSAFAWTSPVIPRLNGHVAPAENPMGAPITPQQESWLAGLLPLGATIGPIISGRLIDRIGRKPTILAISTPLMAAFLITSYAKTVMLLYLARFFMGISAGGIFAVLPIYLGEIADDDNRGRLGCIFGVFVTSGLLYAFSVGPYLNVGEFSLACLAPFTVFLPVFHFIAPETPLFLAGNNSLENARKVLKQLRNASKSEIEKEILIIQSQLSASKRDSEANFCDLTKSSRSLRKGLIVIIVLVILQQFAGINVVTSYMQSIFDSTGSTMPSDISTIIVGLVQVIATILTSSIVEKLGRKILLLISVLGCSISLASLGAYFYLATNDYNVTQLSWMPVLSLLVYIITFNLGLGPLPWALMAEFFPPNFKSNASTLATVICFTSSFIVTLAFPLVALQIGKAQSFWFFGVVCALGACFIYRAVPETKGRSLQEIQDILNK